MLIEQTLLFYCHENGVKRVNRFFFGGGGVILQYFWMPVQSRFLFDPQESFHMHDAFWN